MSKTSLPDRSVSPSLGVHQGFWSFFQSRILKNDSYRSSLAAIFGVGVEYYDYMLYMHFLFIITPLFFPAEDPYVSSLMGMLSFAVGFIARPLGGLIFGHLGDREGRRFSMSYAIFLMSLPTFIIGLLPSYEVIGLWAPVLLVLARCLQGICVGGEITGGSIFLQEHSRPHFRCRASSFINIALLVGSIIGTSLGYLFTQHFFPEWAWRIPFFLGSGFAWLGYYIRYKTSESPEFQKIKSQKKIEKVPLVHVIKHHKLKMLATIGVCAGVMAPFQILYVYIPHVLRQNFHVAPPTIMLVNTITMAVGIPSLYFMGWLGDKWGKRTIMLLACGALFIFGYPLFNLLNYAENVSDVLFLQAIMIIVWTAVTAPCNALVTYFFPTSIRFSGIAFSWALGAIIFAGCAPLISTFLTHWLKNEAAPAFFLMFCAFVCALAVILTRKTTYDDPRSLDQLEVPVS